jgi:hypothetical protein
MQELEFKHGIPNLFTLKGEILTTRLLDKRKEITKTEEIIQYQVHK